MKKLLAGLLVLALCLTLLPAAWAEETEAEDMTLEDFTLESAKRMIAAYGWEGVTGSVKQVGAKLWREASMTRMDLTEEMEESGYLAIFYSEEIQLAVMLQDYGMDLAEYKAAVEDSKYKNIREETVNGREFLLYDESRKKENYCRVAATEEDGQMLEFIFFYDDKSYDTLADVTIATIRWEKAEAK